MDLKQESDIDLFLLRMKKQFMAADIQEKEEYQEESDFGMGFTIRLPHGFAPETGGNAALTFPTRYRPSLILTAPAENAGFTFQLLAGSASESPEVLCGQMKKHIAAVDSKTVFYDTGLAGSDGRAAWLEYKSFASDERVYNLLFLFRTGAGVVMGTFYCIFKEFEAWKPLVFETIDTIKIQTGAWREIKNFTHPDLSSFAGKACEMHES